MHYTEYAIIATDSIQDGRKQGDKGFRITDMPMDNYLFHV